MEENAGEQNFFRDFILACDFKRCTEEIVFRDCGLRRDGMNDFLVAERFDMSPAIAGFAVDDEIVEPCEGSAGAFVENIEGSVGVDRETEKLIFRLLFGGPEGSVASDRRFGGGQMECGPGGGRQFHFRRNIVGQNGNAQCSAAVLADFRARHPQVTYQLYSGNADNTKERIEGGSLDLGVLLEPVDISRYDVLRLPVKEQWGVHVREDSPLARKEAVTARDLASVPLIFTQRGLVQKELERWFGPYGPQIHLAATGNLPYNMTQLARAGMGAFLTVRLRCSYEGLRFLPLSPPLEASTVLAWKKTEAFPPAMEAWLEHIRNAF